MQRLVNNTIGNNFALFRRFDIPMDRPQVWWLVKHLFKKRSVINDATKDQQASN